MKIERFEFSIEPLRIYRDNSMEMNITVRGSGKVLADTYVYTNEYVDGIDNDDMKSLFRHWINRLQDNLEHFIDETNKKEKDQHPITNMLKEFKVKSK